MAKVRFYPNHEMAIKGCEIAWMHPQFHVLGCFSTVPYFGKGESFQFFTLCGVHLGC